MKHYGMPGPGGSLGQCAVCGKSFAVETICGKSVQSFTVKGIDGVLFTHDACMETLKQCEGENWVNPGPLRKAFEEHKPVESNS
jgi:hypothetical protein